MSRRGRILLRAYPPSWRDRYGEEYLALLDDTGVGARTMLDGLRGALDAWLRPPAQVLPGRLRLRATAAVVWCAWVVVAACSMLFWKMTEGKPFWQIDTPHPIGGASYAVFILAGVLSVLAAVAGAAPIGLSMWRSALRERSPRALRLLSVPVLAPVGFLAAVGLISLSVHHSALPGRGVGEAWFLVICALGVVTAVACAAAPAGALREVPAPARLLRPAVIAAVPLTAAMTLTTVSTIVYAVAVRSVPHGPTPAITAELWLLVPYALVMAAACTTAAVSTARGLRALT